MKLQAILFDLDGTLIDQFEAIHRAFARTIEIMGFEPPTYDEVKKSVGGASEATMAKLIGQEHAPEAVKILRPIFEEEMLNGLRSLPFALDAVKLIKKSHMNCAVLTNKYGPHARLICEHLGFGDYLDCVIGAHDTQWKKPDKSLTTYCLDKMKVDHRECVYIGDSPYDYETAINANLECRLVATGTHKLHELENLIGKKKAFQKLKDLVLSLAEEYSFS